MHKVRSMVWLSLCCLETNKARLKLLRIQQAGTAEGRNVQAWGSRQAFAYGYAKVCVVSGGRAL
jgi:hypothetical protein